MLTCERLNVTYIALQPNNKISICEPAAKPEKQTFQHTLLFPQCIEFRRVRRSKKEGEKTTQ